MQGRGGTHRRKPKAHCSQAGPKEMGTPGLLAWLKPHLLGVAELELAAVPRPADAAAACPILEQLQEKLPELNGT